MHILVISGIYDSKPHSGGSLLMKLYVEELRRQGHKVSLLYETSADVVPDYTAAKEADSFYLPSIKNEYYANKGLLNKIITKFRGKENISTQAAGSYFYRDFKYLPQAIEDIQKQEPIEAIQVDFPWMLRVKEVLPQDIPTVFVSHELQFVKKARAGEPDAEQFKKLELELISKFDAVLTLTPVEAEILQTALLDKLVLNSPTGVVQEKDLGQVAAAANKLMFVGGSGHVPNQEALRYLLNDIWPLIQERTTLELHLIGKHEPEFVKQFKANERIHWRGFVDDLTAEMHGAVSLVPVLQGSGIRVKILESMAYGAPVVATTMAAEGIAVEQGRDILIGDTPKSFVEAIVSLTEPHKYRQIALAAQQTVLQHYLLSETVQKRLKVFEDLIK